ncbi:MAG: DUF4870 domain-containing protein [Clostridia bacterium]|nr:DUF4870 domain-containing protein [Clostridia bacterium]
MSNFQKTSSGLNENVAALLSYLFAAVGGLVFILIEKENRFVRFHAMQSLLTFGGLWIASIVARFVPGLGGLLGVLIGLAQFVLWIVCMVKAYKGEWFKLPVVGDIAEQQINK